MSRIVDLSSAEAILAWYKRWRSAHHQLGRYALSSPHFRRASNLLHPTRVIIDSIVAEALRILFLFNLLDKLRIILILVGVYLPRSYSGIWSSIWEVSINLGLLSLNSPSLAGKARLIFDFFLIINWIVLSISFERILGLDLCRFIIFFFSSGVVRADFLDF